MPSSTRQPLLVAALLVLFVSGIAAAQTVDRSEDGLWRASAPGGALSGPAATARSPRLVDLDLPAMAARLARAPKEGDVAARTSSTVVTLPMPDGSFERFGVVSMLIMDPALAAKVPEIRTYRGQGLDDPAAVAQIDVTPLGFHAQVLAPSGRVFVDPAARGQTARYAAYFTRDAVATEPFRCRFEDARPGSPVLPASVRPRPQASSGTQLRQYRLALAATGEYSVAVCAPSPAAFACAFAEMTTAMNRVNGVYEQEVAIRMNMVANESAIVFLDGTTDPYNNGNPSQLLSANQTTLDSLIGNLNYDIGHVFSTAGGGLAALGVPCVTGQKAQGETGLSNPVGDAFYIDYVAHEMGHEWGGNHTFNGTTSNCGGGNRNASTAYEVGSGSTIMAYAGICGAEDLQPHSDPYFHTISFDEIVAYSTTGSGNGCASTSATGNNPPAPNAGGAFTVPKQTPFTLTGSGTDPNSDPLTFCWEEFDLGAAAPPNDDVAAVRPIFRSFNPVSGTSRTFPKLSDVLSGTATFGESMSTRTRTMTFRLTARDNRAGGGGVNYASTTVSVDGVSGPFTVTAPLAAAVWNGGSVQTVSWNVAGTTAAPVSCANVKISLSSDGGNTWPDVLLASTPNDGSQAVTVPTGITSALGRVKVECAAGNVFFNVNPGNFTLNPTPVGLSAFDAR